jgi:hypothetical protein
MKCPPRHAESQHHSKSPTTCGQHCRSSRRHAFCSGLQKTWVGSLSNLDNMHRAVPQACPQDHLVSHPAEVILVKINSPINHCEVQPVEVCPYSQAKHIRTACLALTVLVRPRVVRRSSIHAPPCQTIQHTRSALSDDPACTLLVVRRSSIHAPPCETIQHTRSALSDDPAYTLHLVRRSSIHAPHCQTIQHTSSCVQLSRNPHDLCNKRVWHKNDWLSGTFKIFFRKATISSDISVCPSVLSSVWNNSLPGRKILLNFILGILIRICRENWSLVKITQK